MDFFADGGFQQLFCDLNEQYSSCTMWDNPLAASYSSDYESCYTSLQNISQFHEEDDSLNFENNHHCMLITETETEMDLDQQVETQNLTDLSEKQLQVSLDYLLNTSYDTLDDHHSYSASLPFIVKELSDWEEKFLDNYIEIPELVDFLPEKTPLCTETCNHFLQESAENLKLFPSPPSSPASMFSAESSTPNKPSLRDNSKENDKTYSCNFGDCGKVYAKPAHLKAHLRRHMGEKPYICTWSDCTWRFSRSDELARHRRSHSGIKPYKCSFCVKCFARSDHLTKHRKVHERRLLAASKAGKMLGGVMPQSVLTVRPGRKRKNQL